MLAVLKYELILWFMHFLKFIPGRIGTLIRLYMLPIRKNGRNIRIWDNVQIDSPSKLTVGENTSINRGCILNCGGEIEIGNDVLIAPNVLIYSQNHNFLNKELLINQQGYSFKKVTIGNNVWIAANVIVLPGAIIEDNVVIAAGSIVNKKLESGYLYAGTPVKKIKKI